MKTSTLAKLLLPSISSLWLLGTIAAHADAEVYWTFDDGFDPYTVVIGPGETVTWWNIDVYGFGVHITFNNGFNFQLQDYYGQEVIFPNSPGVYPYHSNWGDNGTVIVDVPPTVGISTPANNSVFPPSTPVTVQAWAFDSSDDFISDIEFYLGTADSTNFVDEVFTPPYSTTLVNLDEGTYTVLAVARDSYGWTWTNAITITVTGSTPTPINLSAARIDGGQFLFDAAGLMAGKTNIVQVSNDLCTWTPVETNIASSTVRTVTNSVSAGWKCFRVLQLP